MPDSGVGAHLTESVLLGRPEEIVDGENQAGFWQSPIRRIPLSSAEEWRKTPRTGRLPRDLRPPENSAVQPQFGRRYSTSDFIDLMGGGVRSLPNRVHHFSEFWHVGVTAI